MFEKLDQIEWASLEHAYGSAEDVPQLIRDLASDDPTVRDEAFYAAYGNIFHQGTRYQATAPAVPFLLEILDQPDYAAHDELLYLLAHLVMGYGEAYMPFGFADAIAAMREDLAELQARTPEQRAEEDGDAEWGSDEEWLGWIVAITDEARQGVPRFIQLLGEGRERVRVAAAFMLSWLPEEAEMFAPALWEAANNDRSDTVRANALIALALALDDDAFAEYVPEVLGMLSDGEPIVQFAAAVALGTRAPDDSPDAVTQILLDAVARAGAEEEEDADADDVEEGDEEARGEPSWMIPWFDGEIGAYASAVLAVACADDPERVVHAVAAALPGMHTMQAANAAGTVLQLIFPEGWDEDAANELEPLQREFLGVLAEVRSPWFLGDATYGNFSLMLTDFGLPGTQDDMRAFIARTGRA